MVQWTTRKYRDDMLDGTTRLAVAVALDGAHYTVYYRMSERKAVEMAKRKKRVAALKKYQASI